MFQFFSILATMIVLILITAAFMFTYIAAISDHIKDSMNGATGINRALLDSSVGVSGASRFLEQARNYNDLFNNDEDLIPKDNNVIFIGVSMYILWIVGLSLVSSVFLGAYNHALASIYGGIAPNVDRALRRGIDQMCTIFNYHILYALAVTIILFITVGIPVLSGMPDFRNIGTIVLGIFVGLILWGVFSALMTAGLPSIVVEKKSAGQAFGRSWKLCQSLLGFVLCTKFMFHLFVFIVSFIVNTVFDFFPSIFSMLGHILVSAAAHALEPM